MCGTEAEIQKLQNQMVLEFLDFCPLPHLARQHHKGRANPPTFKFVSEFLDLKLVHYGRFPTNCRKWARRVRNVGSD